MHKKFDHNSIEMKWQDRWKETDIYRTDGDSAKPKAYVLDMFPYPSGEGLHVGHPKGYIATDVYSRFKKMSGFEVLHPMGWDAFGLPAENFAIKNKIHPPAAVEKNIANFKLQLGELGFNYDWTREINTTDPGYYKWTQWIFLKLLEKGLAYQSYEPINWCPGCQTGLANEDLESDGTCERCGSVVEKKPMRQWVLKITAYADRMLKDLDLLSWPEHIKEAQRNWIGRSEGAEIDFKLTTGEQVTVFTTRADTLFGATYLVLAPEHPLAASLCGTELVSNKDEIFEYIQAAKKKNEIERTDATKEKTGVEIKGIKAINPANGEEIPVYIADYVLAHYGTGAIMAVPAHDERDNEFAEKFNIPVTQVVAPLYDRRENITGAREAAYALIKNKDGEYLLQYYKNANYFWLPGGGIDEGESVIEGLRREIIEETGYTDFTIDEMVGELFFDFTRYSNSQHCRNRGYHYKVTLNSDAQTEVKLEPTEVRDGLTQVWVSREDMDMVLAKGELPRSEYVKQAVALAEGSVYTGSGLLINSGEFDGLHSLEAKKNITEKVGGRAVSTYKIKDWVFSRQRYWGEPIPVIHCEKCGVVPVPFEQLPVTLPEVTEYAPTGTGESPLADIPEWVNVDCPTCGGKGKRETNTMPQWAGSSWYYLRFIDPKNEAALIDPAKEKKWSPVDVYVGGDHAVRHLIYARFWHKFLYDEGMVTSLEPFMRLEFLGFILAEDGRKMSKRWGNIINPSEIVKRNGADTLRVYEMFMGPFENTIAWSTDGLVGAQRFLERVYGLGFHIQDVSPAPVTLLLHQTIEKVSNDIEAFKFNTAISALMIFINLAEKQGLSNEDYKAFLRLVAPFAPHVTEELWAESGETDSIHVSSWPVLNTAILEKREVTIAVAFNGKTRGTVTVPFNTDEAGVLAAVEGEPAFAPYREGKEIQKVIFVPNKIINLL